LTREEHRAKKKLLAMLEKFSVSKDEAEKIASALVELGNIPRGS